MRIVLKIFMNKVMSIFAHQDDETFSAGGVLHKYGQTYAVSVTSDKQREKEFNDACSILDTEPIHLQYENVTAQSQPDIFMELKELIRDIKPTQVITHLDFDYHQEHRLVREIVEESIEWVSHTTGSQKAFQVSSLWAAETTILIPFPHIYIDISENNKARLDAIKCYESQSHKGGDKFYSKFHNTRTSLRGIQANVDHAEAFLQIPIATAGSFKPTKVYQEFPF